MPFLSADQPDKVQNLDSTIVSCESRFSRTKTKSSLNVDLFVVPRGLQAATSLKTCRPQSRSDVCRQGNISTPRARPKLAARADEPLRKSPCFFHFSMELLPDDHSSIVLFCNRCSDQMSVNATPLFLSTNTVNKYISSCRKELTGLAAADYALEAQQSQRNRFRSRPNSWRWSSTSRPRRSFASRQVDDSLDLRRSE